MVSATRRESKEKRAARPATLSPVKDSPDAEEATVALTELKGQAAGTQTVTIERGPVKVFADSLGDANPAYRGEHAPVPPTFPFVMPFWGSMGTGGAAGLPIEKLRGKGRSILHGEQEFEYFAWPKVGDTLEGTATITDVYEKERSNGGKMEFYVLETDWKHAGGGELAVKVRFTLVVTVRPPEG